MEQLSFKLPVFEGPLDLLLHLLSKNKLSIIDISITELLDQYMAIIDAMREENMDVASEFLEMAARLVYLKSVSLLPRQEEEETLRNELAGELLEYRVCRQLAGVLAGRGDGFDRFVRQPAELPPDHTYRLTHQPDELTAAYLAAVGRGQRRLPPPAESFRKLVQRKIISVSSRIVYVLRKLWGGRRVRYQSLFEQAESRSEVVATFLALLELVRANRIDVTGSGENTQITMLQKGKTDGD